jgi:hypothetical protein
MKVPSANVVIGLLPIFAVLATPILGFLTMDVELSQVGQPWGAGDLLSHYQYQDALWNGNEISKIHYGFPNGQDLRVWPFLDFFQSGVVGIFAIWMPIINALNLTIIFSFMFSGLVLRQFGKSLGLEAIPTVVLVIAGSSLPWWPGRIQHFDYLFIFATLIPITVFLRMNKSGKFTIFDTVSILITGLCGPYILAFSLISSSVVLLSSLILIPDMRLLLKKIIFLILLPVCSFFLSYVVFTVGAPQKYPGLNRNITEAIHLSGYALLPFMPLPSTRIPFIGDILQNAKIADARTETTWFSNYGSLLLLLCLALIFACGILAPRLKSRIIGNSGRETRSVIWVLTIQLSLFFLLFIRGGLGVFVSAVLPEIRAWNRLTPVIQILTLALALKLIQVLAREKYKAFIYIGLIMLTVSQIDSVRQMHLVKPQEERLVSMKKFIADYTPKIPQNCAILQLPKVPYPLNGDTFRMEDYDHFLVSILDRKHEFSYGEARLSMTKSSDSIMARKATDDFCAIYLDNFGELNLDLETELIEKYGEPISSTDNRYKLFPIKSPINSSITLQRPE